MCLAPDSSIRPFVSVLVNELRRVFIHRRDPEILNPSNRGFRLLKKARAGRFHDLFVRQVRFFVNKVVFFGLELDNEHEEMFESPSSLARVASYALFFFSDSSSTMAMLANLRKFALLVSSPQ